MDAMAHAEDYPQPPPIITKTVDTMLRENMALLAAAQASREPSSLQESVAFLELAQDNVIRLGKLADIQVIRHGLPTAATDARRPAGSVLQPTHSTNSRSSSSASSAAGPGPGQCGLSERDEALQTFAMTLTAYHIAPPRATHTDGGVPGAASAAATASGTVASAGTAAAEQTPQRGSSRASATTAASRGESSATPGHGGSATAAAAAAAAAAADAGVVAAAPASAARSSGAVATSQSAATPAASSSFASATYGITPTESTASDGAGGGGGGGGGPASAGGGAGTGADASGKKKNRTKWTVDEIALFEQGLERYGESRPSMIAKVVGSRDGEQVRERIRWMRKKMMLASGNSSNGSGSSGGGRIGEGAGGVGIGSAGAGSYMMDFE